MRILRRVAALFVGIAMSSASAELHSKNIRKVWEINLSQYLKERPAMAKRGSHYVSSVRFSDDEGLIAVAAGEHSSGGEYWSHVAIFRLNATLVPAGLCPAERADVCGMKAVMAPAFPVLGQRSYPMLADDSR